MPPKKKKGSPTKQIRIPDHILVQFQKFCNEKDTTLSEFLRYGGNLLIARPELWTEFNAGQNIERPSAAIEALLSEIRELKELIIYQKKEIDSMSATIDELNQLGHLREEQEAKELLKEKVIDLVSKKPMTLEEIKDQITEPGLQKYLFAPPDQMISVLDTVITVLQREGFITLNKKTNRYSSFSLDSK